MDNPIERGDAMTSHVVRPRIWQHPAASDVTGSPRVSRRLWSPASGQFDGVELRAAIVARGWTVRDFADAARVSKGCIYKALAGRAVSDRTVLRIVAVLETRSPSGLIDG